MPDTAKLWADGSLPPPDLSWVWAQESRSAKHVLKLNDITEIWLGFSWKEALELAHWMIAENLVPQKVVACMVSRATQDDVARILRSHCLTFSQEIHGDYEASE